MMSPRPITIAVITISGLFLSVKPNGVAQNSCVSPGLNATPSPPKNLPPLKITSNKVLLADECWLVSSLEIEDGVTIQTNGHKLNIEVFGNLKINGEAIIKAFDQTVLDPLLSKPIKQPKAARGTLYDPNHTQLAQVQGHTGGAGATGAKGTSGVDGQDAQELRVFVMGSATGSLAVFNSGSNGGPGGDGGDGGDGGTGEQGGKSTSVWNNVLFGLGFYTCGSGPGYGGKGGDGGTGGQAGSGGRAGNGGAVNLFIVGDSHQFHVTNLSISPGQPGESGVPGLGGTSGCPGFGGLGGPACQGIETIPGPAGSNGADGSLEVLKYGKDGYHNLKWFSFYRAPDQPAVNKGQCSNFPRPCGDTPDNPCDTPQNADEQIAVLWDQVSEKMDSVKSTKIPVAGGADAYVIELAKPPLDWEKYLAGATYQFTKSPSVAPPDCNTSPDVECVLKSPVSTDGQLQNAADRIQILLRLLLMYAEELSRKSLIVNTIQSAGALPLTPYGIYFKWPYSFAGPNGPEQLFTKIDEETLSRLSRTTGLVLGQLRTAIGSSHIGKDTLICSLEGYDAASYPLDQLPSSFLPLDVSTGQPTRLYGSNVDRAFTLQVRSSNSHSYLALKNGVVPPISSENPSFCDYTERISHLRFQCLECLGAGSTTAVVSLIRNALYHKSSSVFFFNLLYLRGVFNAEKLDSFDMNNLWNVVMKPNCIGHP